jgi:ABC-2 type transport system ATP-binding protein
MFGPPIIMDILLNLSAVRKCYRRPSVLWRFWEKRPLVVALDDAALTVRSGELVVLLGPNGAGKTTLLKVAAGALLPDAGVASLNARAGLVAGGERSFYWRLSGAENLRFFAAVFGVAPAARAGAVGAALERVGLADRAADPVWTYSTGMRHRLAFARALLGEPRLLLVDEFGGGMDYGVTLALGRFLREELAAREGRGVLLATHQLWLARLLADRVYVLARGKVVAAGAPEEVLGPPRARYGARVRGAEAAALAAALAGVVPDVQSETDAAGAFISFAEPASAAALAAAFELLAAKGATPAARGAEPAETAYLSLLAERGDA